MSGGNNHKIVVMLQVFDTIPMAHASLFSVVYTKEDITLAILAAHYVIVFFPDECSQFSRTIN